MSAVDASRRSWLAWLVEVTCILCIALTGGRAMAQSLSEEVIFDIPSQPLASAVIAFSEQSRLQVVTAGEDLSGLVTQGVSGQKTISAGLAKLLEGTPLRYTAVGASTVSLHRDDKHSAAHAGNAASFAATSTDAQANSAIEEVVVTAQKRSENVQDVPSSITVMSAGRLQNLNAAQLTDYAAYIPGLSVSAQGRPGRNQIALRGIFAGPAGGSTVGTYIDDTPVGSSSSYAQGSILTLDLMPYDVERMEVLRGPQGTLYGASTMGGLLKYVTKSPDLNESEVRVGSDISTTQAASAMGWGTKGSVNVPIVEGSLAVRASAYYQYTPGYIDNVATGKHDENVNRQKGGRLALLWQPTNRLSLKLSAIHQQIEADDLSLVPLDYATRQPIFGALRRANQIPEDSDSRLDLYAATLNYDLGWAEFTSASSYARSEALSYDDSTPTFGPLLQLLYPAGGLTPGYLAIKLDKFTQEFRLASPSGGRIEWLAGAFYTDEDASNHQIVGAADMSRTAIPGIDPLMQVSLPSSYREYALFGDVTYRFTDTFDLTAGIRGAHNEQTFKQIFAGAFAGLLFPTGSIPGKSSETVLTYMVSPRYHITPDTMVYARVASSYRPGGPNIMLPGVPPTFDADTLVNYELGLKTEFLDRRAMINLAAFYIDWKDIQIVGLTSGLSYLANGGTAVSKGLEFSTLYSPVDGLRLGLNAAYTDARLTEDVPSLVGLSGDRLPSVPRWSAALTADYELVLGGDWKGSLNGGYRFVGSRAGLFFPRNPLSFPLKDYGALDLSAGLTNQRWNFRVFATNLTNERAYVSGGPNGSFFDAAILRPRTVGMSADLRF